MTAAFNNVVALTPSLRSISHLTLDLFHTRPLLTISQRTPTDLGSLPKHQDNGNNKKQS